MSQATSMTTTKIEDTTKPNEELMFEYGELRREILQNDTMILQLMSVIITLVGLLMGFAITQTQDRVTQGIIFLVCAIISCFGVYHHTDRMKNTQRIASYIRIFIESQLPHVKWETRIRSYRSFRINTNYNPLDHFKFMTDQRFIYLTIIAVNTFLGIYSLVTERQTISSSQSPNTILPVPIQTIAIFALIFLVINAIAIYLTRSTRNKLYVNSFDALWKKVRGDESLKDQAQVQR